MAGQRKNTRSRGIEARSEVGRQATRDTVSPTTSPSDAQVPASQRSIAESSKRRRETIESISAPVSDTEEEVLSSTRRQKIRHNVASQLMDNEINIGKEKNIDESRLQYTASEKRVSIQPLGRTSVSFDINRQKQRNSIGSSSLLYNHPSRSHLSTDPSNRRRSTPISHSTQPRMHRYEGISDRRANVSFDIESNIEDENTDSEGVYLWVGTYRRPKGNSSEGHQLVFNLAKTHLVSRALSGQGPEKRTCTAWPDQFLTQANAMIKESWVYIRDGRFKFGLDTSLQVDDTPKNFEARKMLDAIGEFRSHVMEKVRAVVETHYCFGDPKNHRERVAALLYQDSFALADDNKKKGGRFLSSVIVKSIAKSFFYAGSKDSLGLQPHTAKAFSPLRGHTIVFITACICWALSEYETGKRVAKKFEGGDVDTIYHRVSKTWFEQSNDRQKILLKILDVRVREQSGFEDGKIDEACQAIPNEFKDSLEDMEDCLDDLPPDLQDLIRAKSGISLSDSVYYSHLDDRGEQGPHRQQKDVVHRRVTVKAGMTQSKIISADSFSVNASTDDAESFPVNASTDDAESFPVNASTDDAESFPVNPSADDKYLDDAATDTWTLEWDNADDQIVRHDLPFDLLWEEFCQYIMENFGDVKLWYAERGGAERILQDGEEYKQMVDLARRVGVVKIRKERDDEYESPP